MKFWKRKEWTANRADPTQVISWKLRTKFLKISLLESWGVGSEVSIFGRTFVNHDAWWAVRMFSFLEDREALRGDQFVDVIRFYE